jgi:hypothetical protein
MSLDASGNLGIGLSPITKLDVQATTTSGSSFGLRVSAGTNSSDYTARFNNAAGTATHLEISGAGNVGINTNTFGTSAAGVLSIANGTAPSSGPADTVQLFSVDRTAGNTIPGIRCEGSGVTNAGITSTTVTHKIAMQVNGTIYYLLATTNAT